MAVIIQVSDLNFFNKDGLLVLEDIHLQVNHEEFVFLVGPAEAGKSLLLRLILGEVHPPRGQILVHGRNIGRLNYQKHIDLRQKIGVMPQGFVPLPKTVIGNLLFKLRCLGNFIEEAEEKATAALEEIGLADKRDQMAVELSPVDQIKLGLAFTICHEPVILICDEPLAGLNGSNAEDILQTLGRINASGITTLVATRNREIAEKSGHRVMILHDGTIKKL
ncbi:ATP-binding cassette domain-containing protein [Candidatus Acetothermia bacterium]|jgi:ABC-type ATPase involved in cell division|nr:ATP-binding cassette domain-containing protein [Candidatus Acetothermia bacterium]MCI2427742.1 ATP-binding cassette domain-containing protein [Candidatus Acetothermia bacterium]MCI2428813.1 ATP-binding cassette domain-containing protein [Candidatus Acetothermia bacterium]